MTPKQGNKTIAPTKAAPKHDGDIRPLGALLEAIVTVFKRYVIFRSQAQVRVIALWVMHTHTIDAFDFTPYRCSPLRAIATPDARCRPRCLSRQRTRRRAGGACRLPLSSRLCWRP